MEEKDKIIIDLVDVIGKALGEHAHNEKFVDTFIDRLQKWAARGKLAVCTGLETFPNYVSVNHVVATVRSVKIGAGQVKCRLESVNNPSFAPIASLSQAQIAENIELVITTRKTSSGAELLDQLYFHIVGLEK